jgi:hypothetical protein
MPCVTFRTTNHSSSQTHKKPKPIQFIAATVYGTVERIGTVVQRPPLLTLLTIATTWLSTKWLHRQWRCLAERQNLKMEAAADI